MQRSIALALGFSALLATAACKDSSKSPPGAPPPGSAPAGAGPSASERDADASMVKKMNAAVHCINFAAAAVKRSAGFYARAVDPATGPLPDKSLYLQRIDAQSCTKPAKEAVALKPAVADLDAVLGAYATKLDAAALILNEAADYYDQKRHLDDALAKGKQLHPQVMASFEDVIASERQLRDVLDKLDRARREANLAELAKDPAQRTEYLRERLMLSATDLIKLTEVGDLAKLDAAAFQAKLDEVDKTQKELSALGLDGSDLGLSNSARDYVGAGLAMVRRLRDGKGYTESELKDLAQGSKYVEGSIPQLIESYNSLIEASNRLR
ncbi:MAG: DUF3829 domain-containing protein [Kofleriaceae bacterium]